MEKMLFLDQNPKLFKLWISRDMLNDCWNSSVRCAVWSCDYQMKLTKLDFSGWPKLAKRNVQDELYSLGNSYRYGCFHINDNYIVVSTQPTLNLFNRRTMKMERKITANGYHYTTFRIRENLWCRPKSEPFMFMKPTRANRWFNFMHSQLKQM